MKNKDVLRLWAGLNKLSNKNNTKFSFVIFRNKKKLKDVVEALKTVQLLKVDGQDEFERERIELCKKYANLDAKGDPIRVKVPNTNMESYQIDNIDEFNGEIEKLLDRHSDYKERLRIKKEEINQLLEQEVQDLDLIKLSLEDLPTDLSESEIEMIEEIILET